MFKRGRTDRVCTDVYVMAPSLAPSATPGSISKSKKASRFAQVKRHGLLAVIPNLCNLSKLNCAQVTTIVAVNECVCLNGTPAVGTRYASVSVCGWYVTLPEVGLHLPKQTDRNPTSMHMPLVGMTRS